MGYCRLYTLTRGAIQELGTYKNAHGFCMFIWMSLSEKYLTGGLVGWGLSPQPLWDLATDPRLSDFERITLESTFDHVVIRVEDLDAYAQALDEFCAKYPPGDRVCHLPEIAKNLRESEFDGVLGIGWHGTSSSDDPWMIRSDEGTTMYDVTKRDEHWHLDFKKEAVTVVDSVPELVDKILENRIREILYPGGDMQHEWSSDELNRIAAALETHKEGQEEQMISASVKNEIDMHVAQGVPCGDFVTAVLDNNLKEAFNRADDYNRITMFSIVSYMYNHTPSSCQGSKQNRQAWQAHNGLAGLSETPWPWRKANRVTECKPDYGSMTDDEFREILEEFVREEGASILYIDGVYSPLSEHFNNDVLDRWAERNEERAYPPREEEEDDD